MLRKQIFYLTNEQLWAYQWDHGQLSAGHRFPFDAAGLEAFAAYLESRANTPAYLVADLVEEDFQRHLLPHVGGGAGRALIARRLGQLYRDTPYRYAAIQGREREGRRDDSVLFCALTNPAIVQPWVQLLEQACIALAGIYSATLLSAALVARLRLTRQHLLLVTRHSAGLRQSYFLDGRLKFSRLTPADDSGAAADIGAETNRTRQFLTSTRLLARGDVLHAVVLGPAGQAAALAAGCRDGAELHYHFSDSAAAAARIRVAAPALPEQLLLAGLGRRAPASHYALGRYGRFHTLWRARLALYGASAATLTGAALWLGANLWGGYSAAADSAALRAETARLDQRNQAVQATLPATVERSANMKAAVLIEQAALQRGPAPEPLLARVSAALERVAQIQLTRLDWQVSLPGAAAPAAGGQPAPAHQEPAAPMSSLLIGVPAAPPQNLRLEAEVMLPPEDERSVLDSMNQFAGELARDSRLQVEIVQPALDVRPSVKLAGKAGNEAGDSRATFILNIRWQP